MARTHKTAPHEPTSITGNEALVSDVLLDSIGDGVFIIDERGYITQINQIALDILGFSDKDLIGKWLPEVLVAENENGDVIPNFERPATEAFLSGKPVAKRVYYRKKGDGRVAVAINVAPIIRRNKPIGAIELLRDITADLQLERAKDEFISIASHQLRTPATVVKQNLGLILEGFVGSEIKQRELLETAYRHNDTQLQIINDLLNIAQVEAGKLRPNIQEIDINALLQRVVDSQATDYHKRNIALTYESKAGSAVVRADRLHMQMVFENLINNAQKYSPEGSAVTVTTTATSKEVTVRIKDQGIGIAAKDIPTLFRKFSRVQNVESMASGTGLGLYWAKKLVDLQGGSIKVSSQPNKGTTFSVIIPRDTYDYTHR